MATSYVKLLSRAQKYTSTEELLRSLRMLDGKIDRHDRSRKRNRENNRKIEIKENKLGEQQERHKRQGR